MGDSSPLTRAAVVDFEVSEIGAEVGFLICAVIYEPGGKRNEPEVYAISGYPGRTTFDDRSLVRAVGDRLSEVDLIIGHYLMKFDLPYLRARQTYHRLPVLGGKLIGDTYSIARSRLRLKSYSLASVADFLGVGQKLAVPLATFKRAQFWREASEDLRTVIQRCTSDVLLTAEVFRVLRDSGHVRAYRWV